MLKSVDVGLMADHLPAHEGVISRLNLYLQLTQDMNVLQILEKQLTIMENHVMVMNQLLNPNHHGIVNLPPIPQQVNNYNGNHLLGMNTNIHDRHIVLDAHFTATAMANENFVSASAMKTPLVKQLHLEMGLQQSTIAQLYDQVIVNNGWTRQPNATQQEQLSAMNKVNFNINYQNNTNVSP